MSLINLDLKTNICSLVGSGWHVARMEVCLRLFGLFNADVISFCLLTSFHMYFKFKEQDPDSSQEKEKEQDPDLKNNIKISNESCGSCSQWATGHPPKINISVYVRVRVPTKSKTSN